MSLINWKGTPHTSRYPINVNVAKPPTPWKGELTDKTHTYPIVTLRKTLNITADAPPNVVIQITLNPTKPNLQFLMDSPVDMSWQDLNELHLVVHEAREYLKDYHNTNE